MLNIRLHDVMFPDSDVQQYSTNGIAQSIYVPSNEDGHRYELFDEILGIKIWRIPKIRQRDM